MVKSEVPHERNEFEELEESIGEGVCDVCLQPGKYGLVVESIQECISLQCNHNPMIVRFLPEIEIVDTKSTVLDFDVASGESET